MDAQLLSAIAAACAAVISLVNVGISSRLVRRQDDTRWIRERLPQLVTAYAEAVFQFERKVFETDWTVLSAEEREKLGLDEGVKALGILAEFEVFASPETVDTAHAVFHAADLIRMTRREEPAAKRWDLYWAWAEAKQDFLTAARREMGLKAPSVPSGLKAHRERSKRGGSDGGAGGEQP
ncbi:hypothetical protein [Phytomonospora endophytica]|uniref:DUF4760 domain-containing protein n=1 Tax=Phytomonospora endophytica TaxID=714109 RepID=A0A841FPN3_9ACTN|nr:hypothetical protein [Phytomonospora endophytica]MBB6035217.1 hypothetical protein [Phytomonospora endophytica]